jgi:hypothetical protein
MAYMPNLATKQQCGTNLALISPLGEIELEACRLRFEGYSSTEIETNLARHYGDRGPKAKTVRSWFSRGGKLCEFYKSYAEEEVRVRHTVAQQIFQAHVKNAARTMIQIMLDPTRPSMARFRVAKYIIDRELGPPPKAPVGSECKNPAREILEELELINLKS